MKNSRNVIWIIAGIVIILIICILVLLYFELKGNSINYNDYSEDGTFSTTYIRESHSYMKNDNYMISPYSIEIALSMLREGAKGETLDELNNVVPKRSIKTLIVNNKVNIANAIFIKDIYKNDMLPSYMDTLDKDYNADVIYDRFNTPNKINSWVKQETKGMIPKLLDQMDPQFVLGVANAVAMDEEWKIPFECRNTVGYAFEKRDGKQYDTAMMTNSYDNTVSYYEDDMSQAIILPYKSYNRVSGKEDKDVEQLDFVGILPKDLDKYVESFSLDRMEAIVDKSRKASDKLEVSVSLPRFEFEYDFKDFKDSLENVGIKKIFGQCDLSGMINNHDDMFVSEAIHKSYVKVSETGTKAAAVTYFGTKENAAPVEDEKEYVSIIFDKPFVFLIKDHSSNEILFFGVVYEPEKWDATKTCE